MKTKLKAYIPIAVFLLLSTALGAWAITSVMPGFDDSVPVASNTVSKKNPATEYRVESEIAAGYIREPFWDSDETDIEELNRRLIAEGLDPIIIPPEPVNETKPENPQPSVVAIDAEPEEKLSTPNPVGSIPEPAAPIEETESIPEPVEMHPVPTELPPPVIRTAASYDLNPEPPYPRAAERRGIEGTVILKVLVDVDGEPAAVEILKSSGNELLDRAAVDAISNTWRFKPATVGGMAIESWVEVPVVFTLL